ncbi:hypothetical protein I546_5243 [Mycobacterium kansasii 732]|nr:hypothetical protein I546_5243 [Mycobacterium kansasii 732]
MSAGRDQNAADTRSVLVSDDETASTAAELRALAEQAEAEAAEAEALAAAARARARAIQLRRRAEVADGADEGPVAEEDPATEEVHAEVSKGEPDNSETTVVPETIEAERGSDVEDEDRDADVSAAADEALPRRRRRPRLTRSTVAAALAAIVILVALSASVYMVVQHRDAIRHRERVAEFAAAARQGVVTLTSLDFTNAKQGVQRILDNSTGRSATIWQRWQPISSRWSNSRRWSSRAPSRPSPSTWTP